MVAESEHSPLSPQKLAQVRNVGFWTAVLTTAFYLMFDVAAISIMMNAITSKYWISISSYLPSLFLALTFIMMVASIHFLAPQEYKFWTLLGLVFATVYATVNCFIYIIQVLSIAPSYLNGAFDKIAMFEMASDKPLWSANALAYTLMSVSTFFVSFAIQGKGLRAWTRIMLRIHGIVAPTIVGVLVWQPLFYISATVGFTYPVAAILLAILLKKEKGWL